MGKKSAIKIYGLIGATLSYSFSKKYFGKKFLKEKINASYQNFELKNIVSFKELITKNNFTGLNVTIPYKTTIIPFLDELDEVAEKINAVNTIKFENGKLIGFNTDIIGFQNSLKPLLKKNHSHALILGTGGASKAIKYALQDLEITSTFVSRTVKPQSFIYEDLNESIIAKHQIIINTTPLGTFPNVNEKPSLPYQYISENHLLFDLVYNPNITAFMQKGIYKNAIVKNGYEMLELQAEASWKIWNSESDF